MLEPQHPSGPSHPLVEFCDDERNIGNGIIVTLKAGAYFYDDCRVMGFDNGRTAISAIAKAARAIVAKTKAAGPNPKRKRRHKAAVINRQDPND